MDIYYDTIKSEECVPLGHTVNANLAVVSGFSLHEDRMEAIKRGQPGFDFFGYALQALVARDIVPGRTDLWGESAEWRAERTQRKLDEAAELGDQYSGCIGTPDDARRYLNEVAACGVDQVIFMQQAGRNKHEDICSSLQLFGDTLMADFKAAEAERQAAKDQELAPYIEAALARKQFMAPLADDEIPIVRASVKKPQTSGRI